MAERSTRAHDIALPLATTLPLSLFQTSNKRMLATTRVKRTISMAELRALEPWWLMV